MENNQTNLFCKELNLLFYILGILLTLTLLYMIFGWGKNDIGRINQTGQGIETLRPPNTPEIEVGAGVGANGVREIEGILPGRGAQRVNFGFPDKTAVGASVLPIDMFSKESLKLNTTEGVIIHSVARGSDSFKAGLKTDDVVIRINNNQIENVKDFTDAVNHFRPGMRYKFSVIRSEKNRNLNLIFSNNLKQVALKSKKTITWIGADIQDIDAMLKSHFKLPNNKGAIVSFVENNSPADKAGILQSDVIKGFGNKKIKNIKDLQDLVIRKKPGDKIRLTIIRGKEVITPYITLNSKPLNVQEKPQFLPEAAVEIEASWLGLGLAPLNKTEAKEMGVPAGQKGMVVETVGSGIGSKAGMKASDVITSINGEPVNSLNDFMDATENANGAVIDILRAGKHLYITVEAPTALAKGKKKGLVQVANRLNNIVYKKIAVTSYGPTLFDQIYPDFKSSPYILIYDPNNGSFEKIQNNGLNELVLSQLIISKNVGAVITGNVATQMKAQLLSENIAVFSGVFGNIANAVNMYKANKLVMTY